MHRFVAVAIALAALAIFIPTAMAVPRGQPFLGEPHDSTCNGVAVQMQLLPSGGATFWLISAPAGSGIASGHYLIKSVTLTFPTEQFEKSYGVKAGRGLPIHCVGTSTFEGTQYSIDSYSVFVG
jgi:hypothetical protein